MLSALWSPRVLNAGIDTAHSMQVASDVMLELCIHPMSDMHDATVFAMLAYANARVLTSCVSPSCNLQPECRLVIWFCFLLTLSLLVLSMCCVCLMYVLWLCAQDAWHPACLLAFSQSLALSECMLPCRAYPWPVHMCTHACRMAGSSRSTSCSSVQVILCKECDSVVPSRGQAQGVAATSMPASIHAGKATYLPDRQAEALACSSYRSLPGSCMIMHDHYEDARQTLSVTACLPQWLGSLPCSIHTRLVHLSCYAHQRCQRGLWSASCQPASIASWLR